MRWTVRPEITQPFGIVHGGMYCAAVESSASVGAALWFGDGERARGRGQQPDRLLPRGHRGRADRRRPRPIHRGRSQQVWRVDITDEHGRLVAQGQVRLQNLTDSHRGPGHRQRTLDDKETPVSSATFTHAGRRDARPRRQRRHRRRARRRTSASCCRRPAWSPSTPASPTPRRARPTITYIDGDAGILRYRGYPIDQLAEESTFLETSYLLIYGELPTADAAGRVRGADPAAHAAARGPQAVLRRLPARRAPDAGAVVGGVGAVDLLPGRARPVRRGRRRAVDRPAAGQAADDRRLRVQEVGRASRSSTRTTRSGWSRTSCG